MTPSPRKNTNPTMIPLLTIIIIIIIELTSSSSSSPSTTTTTSVVIVVPCYNEANRLNVTRFESFERENEDDVSFLFVDDGSTDQTFEKLKDSSLQHVMRLKRNQGKAEAVRIGMIEAMSWKDTKITGFFDADLATPLIPTVNDFLQILKHNENIEMVFGARVALLGRHVKRHMSRHYLGRIFATMASMILNLRIYDTQCGAKLFRVNKDLKSVLRKTFETDWIFDVELLARFSKLKKLEERIWEEPLKEWVDVKGSKLKLWDKVKAIWGLGKIWWRYFCCFGGRGGNGEL